MFQNINPLYDKIYNIISEVSEYNDILLFTDFIEQEINSTFSFDSLFKDINIKKEYESQLFKLEDERMKLAKAREKILISLAGKENIEIRKYITQSMKLEQEIPHISEYNFKRKNGYTITPKERDNLIKLEKMIDNDNEWRDTILSNFIKVDSKAVQDVKKINKAITTILNKEGEILYHINEKEKVISDFKDKGSNIDNEKFQQTIEVMIQNIKDIFSNYFVESFIPLNANDVISIKDLNFHITDIYKSDEKFVEYLSVRKKRKPSVLLLPFKVIPTYDSKKNFILLPIYENEISNIYRAYAKFKWEADTRNDVKKIFYNLNSNKGIDAAIIEKRFIDSFILFFVNPSKFRETVKPDVNDFFNKIFK